FELHLPRPERASGAALVMLPGGGLRVLGTGASLQDEIDALVAQGVAVLMLEYRTLQFSPEELARMTAPPPPRDPAAPPAVPTRFPRMEIVNGNANPATGNERMSVVLELATDDAQAALRLLHENAAEWHIDPDRIGVMGTSAGGGVAFGALLDRAAPDEEQPDFLVSIFGPSLQDVAVWEGAPPLFMAVEAEHGAVTDGLIEVFRIWNEAYQPAELQIYDVPNFTMTEKLWGPRLFDWMRSRGILPAAD
ncbi:MAG TPA: alpha/beta hydrolase fold domain-containing protein, partial [Paracoccaceae bacterium]|nr:alpha/beta hydrolase fold domain-containing protein [Paracoccaceae bacterium]